jgi:hypothetical protein
VALLAGALLPLFPGAREREDRGIRRPLELIMTTAADTLSDSLRLDFELACRDLVEAERALARRDDAATRARLRACWDRVDVVLDMWNDLAGRA